LDEDWGRLDRIQAQVRRKSYWYAVPYMVRGMIYIYRVPLPRTKQNIRNSNSGKVFWLQTSPKWFLPLPFGIKGQEFVENGGGTQKYSKNTFYNIILLNLEMNSMEKQEE